MYKGQRIEDDDLEWQDYFQDLHLGQNACLQNLFEYRDIDTQHEMNNEKQLQQQQKNTEKTQNTFFSHNSINKMIDEVFQNEDKSDQQLDSNQSSSKNQKEGKSDKQRFYSKTYRQKMKQKYANLQEQNEFLKKRIKELQNQLRQQEIELSRYKYPPPEKELSGEYLGKQWVQVAQNILEELRSNPNEADGLKKQQCLPDTQYYKFSVEFYAERGFAGTKKLQILNYHFNEILQNILKDSEKYLSLVFANSKHHDQLQPLPEFEAINNIFMQIFKDDGDLWKRLKIFTKFLFPTLLQFNKLVSKFSKTYEQILVCSQKVHNFVIENYLKNMQVPRRRVQIEKWFEFYKYGKLMRRLRYQWYDWMKLLAKKEEQESKRSKAGTKKKKTTQVLQR